MTIVTTSRKPVPELRSLAKDLAFAIGCRYMIRGKMGLPGIESIDPVFFLLYLEKKDFRLQLIDHGAVVLDYLIAVQEISTRSAKKIEGILLSDQSVYEDLEPYIPVKLSGDGEEKLIFDGTRKRRYTLRVVAHGA